MTLFVSDFSVTVRPNSSLSVANTIKLVCVLALVSMIVGVGFALAGAWMVLPFAGLEVVAIAYAFYFVVKHSSDYESIIIMGDDVVIEKHSYKSSSRTVFPRYWVRASLREKSNGKLALFLGSHGKEVEFGQHLMCDEQRSQLTRQLKAQLNKNY